MDSIISCKVNKMGGHSFFIKHAGKEYYLFSQNYHRGVDSHFSKGISIQNALSVKSAKHDRYVMKTIIKMKPHIKYIEKEYDVKILKNTKEKGTINKRKFIPIRENWEDEFIY